MSRAVPLDAAAQRLEQPRRELRQRRLAAAVRAGERDDLAAAQLEAFALEHEEVVVVGERDLVETTHGRAGRWRGCVGGPIGHERRVMLVEPGVRSVRRSVEHNPPGLEEEHAVGHAKR
jgi:hypothetical protein